MLYRKYINNITKSFIILIPLSHLALAATINTNNDFLHSWFISLSGGPTWHHNGNQQTLLLTPNIEKTYTANSTSDAVTNGELFVGFHHALNNKIDGQYGIALATTNGAIFSGQIWDDADPQFNNYSYSYKVQRTYLGAKAKLLLDTNCPRLLPWISASLGVSFNKAYSYQDTPLIPEAISNPAFASNTTTAFSYTLGVGLQYAIDQNWQAGLGYEFSDWGRSELGTASGQTTGHGLAQQHLYTNGLIFNITYLN